MAVSGNFADPGSAKHAAEPSAQKLLADHPSRLQPLEGTSCCRGSGWPQDSLDHSAGALVEALVEARRILQAAMVGDDAAGTGAAGDDQVPQAGGVAAVVGAAEVERHPLLNSVAQWIRRDPSPLPSGAGARSLSA
jgi:hypothetical protein